MTLLQYYICWYTINDENYISVNNDSTDTSLASFPDYNTDINARGSMYNLLKPYFHCQFPSFIECFTRKKVIINLESMNYLKLFCSHNCTYNHKSYSRMVCIHHQVFHWVCRSDTLALYENKSIRFRTQIVFSNIIVEYYNINHCIKYCMFIHTSYCFMHLSLF